MNIAIFTDVFIPLSNGVVTTTINLSKSLADRNHKVVIIAPKLKNKEELHYRNMKVVRINSFPAFFYPDFRFTYFYSDEILRLLKKEKIDIIHFQTPMPLGLMSIILSKILKIPLIGTFHTLFSDKQYLKHAGLDYSIFENLSWKYIRLIYNKCDLITCPTETMKKELLNNGLKRPIIAISNGINISAFKNKNYKKIRIELLGSKNDKLLMYVGRISYDKNLFYLLDCFKIATKKREGLKLLIIGDGPQLSELKQKAKSLNLTDHIIFTGNIRYEELIKSSLYKACDFFITASTTETQAITLLEAQANNLPCIVINKRGVKDVIKNNYNGLSVNDNNKEEFADAIVELSNNKSLYRKLKYNTRKEIKKHELSKIVRITASHPKKAPIIANSLTSPPPIPSLLNNH